MPFFSGDTPQQFRVRLRRIYVLYTAGFVLMILLYYATTGIYMIGPESPIKTPAAAVATSLGFLTCTWFAYDYF